MQDKLFIHLFDLRLVPNADVFAPKPSRFHQSRCMERLEATFCAVQKSHKTQCRNWGDTNEQFHAMGPEAGSAFRTLQFTDDAEKDKNNIVLRKFDEYFKPKPMLSMNVHNLIWGVRGLVKVLTPFFARCMTCETCDFGNNKDELIRDRIVTGLLDKGQGTRELQLKSDLTLSVAVQLAKQHEVAKAQLSIQSDTGSKLLKELKSQKFGRASKMSSRSAPSPTSRGATGNSSSSGLHCGRCEYVHNSSVCPAQGKKCRKYHKLNHFASSCKAKRETHELTSESPDTVTDSNHDAYYLSEVRDVSDNTGAWFTAYQLRMWMLSSK